MLTDDDLQKAFHLISVLHPDRAVGLCVLLDAYDRISLIRKNQVRRPDATHPTKLIIPEESLLQFATYAASEIWEKDQESDHPRKEPRYKPTDEDKLVRYVKTLAWKSMDRHSRYAAVGLGCLLYTYQPHEVSSLAEDLFNSDNIRRNKSWMFDQIKKRFQGTKGFTNGNEHVELGVPSSRQRALIQKSLSAFAPWCSCPAAARSPSASLLETYFNQDSKRSEWERVHVLFDPACGGFPRLVNEYNSTYRSDSNMRLDDPENKLGSPKFGDGFNEPPGDGGDGGPSDPEDRFNPSPLIHHELSSIKHSFERNQHRRKNYRAGQLRVFVDGEEANAFAHDYFIEPFIIPNTASCIEVYGEDDEGELLLAVFPLTYLETGDGSIPEQKLSVTHDGGQTIELILSPVPGQSRESPETLVRVEYLEPSQSADFGCYGYGAGWFFDDEPQGREGRSGDEQPGEPEGPHIRVFLHGTTIVERYRILGQIRSGGLGAVYSAEDLRLNTPVVIKVLGTKAEEGASAAWARVVIKKEIEALLRVEHPGVALPLDFGELPDGRPYLVMQNVRGVTLREELEPKGMELSRIADLGCQIAETLAAAHAQGILHRDVKPENVMIQRDGRVRLMDFSIAMWRLGYDIARLETDALQSDATPDAGSVRKFEDEFGYVSPEQLLGQPAQHTSDIYALGVMIFEMITGSRPFISETPQQLLELQRAGLQLNLCDLRPGLPQTLQSVIARALAFEPQNRYNSAKEFSAALAYALAVEMRKDSAEGLRPSQAWLNGEMPLDELMLLIKGRLQRIAAYYVHRDNLEHTLQTSELVNEAYLKLMSQTQVHWQSHANFLAVAARIMRHVLLDHARGQRKAKRSGAAAAEFHEETSLSTEKFDELFALDEALVKLATSDPLKSKIIELRRFGGLTIKEIAEELQLASITVMRHWGGAKLWLRRELRKSNEKKLSTGT